MRDLRMKSFFVVALLAGVSLLSGFKAAEPLDSLDGVWIRRSDNLRIHIDKERASIVQEGNEKFPCELDDMFIYKDIRKVKDNQWTCQFLVVTMGSCKTEYESGELFINRQGDLVIICPGFDSKIYVKAKSRYEG